MSGIKSAASLVATVRGSTVCQTQLWGVAGPGGCQIITNNRCRNYLVFVVRQTSILHLCRRTTQVITSSLLKVYPIFDELPQSNEALENSWVVPAKLTPGEREELRTVRHDHDSARSSRKWHERVLPSDDCCCRMHSMITGDTNGGEHFAMTVVPAPTSW